jgi:hypothetical protein
MSDVEIYIERAPRGNVMGRGELLPYIVTYRGEEIGRWVDPAHEAARWLVKHGQAAREDRLVTFRPGGVKSMTGSVGWFADRRVEEGRRSGPRLAKWAPFPGLTNVTGASED